MALPVVTISWNTNQQNTPAPFGWNISNEGNTIRFDVQDSANCGGPNGSVQSGVATATLVAQARFNMSVSLTGLGEAQDPGFENMTLSLNGTNIITATSAGGGRGCATGVPIVQTLLVPGPYFLAKNSSNTFRLSFTTRDALYHVGCFYQCNLSFQLLDPPEIFTFLASPNPQTSGTAGVPSDSTTLQWSTFGAETLTINQGVGNLSTANGSQLINTGLQSVAGTTSPATKNYTLTATNTAGSAISTITVGVYNDNTPNDFNFANNKIIRNGDLLRVRVFSQPFNTSPDGLTNTSNHYVDVGTVRRNFSVTTRAPIVSEVFDYPNEDGFYPYPKIDTTSNTPSQYIESDAITVNDIELSSPNGVEVKTDKADTQVRIKKLGDTNFGSWTDVRSI